MSLFQSGKKDVDGRDKLGHDEPFALHIFLSARTFVGRIHLQAWTLHRRAEPRAHPHRNRKGPDMRTHRIIGHGIFALALAAGGARAALAEEYKGTWEQQMACTPDVWRLCSDQIPDVNRIVACLQQNTPSLSSGCRAVFQSNNSVPQSQAVPPPAQRGRAAPPPASRTAPPPAAEDYDD
jgi:hypothetical protein